MCGGKVLIGGIVRFSLKDLEKDYEKTEDDIKAVQSVGQIIGEVMKQLDTDRCAFSTALYPQGLPQMMSVLPRW